MISKFVASNFLNILTSMKSYNQKHYEQALIETYLKFDELLRTKKINAFLKENLRGYMPLELSNSSSHINKENIPVSKEDSFKICKSSKKSEIKNKGTNLNQSEESTKTFETIMFESKRINISPTDNELENFDELISKDMGTTANILFIKNNYMYFANVGDSISVMFKSGQAIKINSEHKTTLVSEFTRISKSGAKIYNNRIDGRLNLTRAIGKNSSLILIGDLNFKKNPHLKFYDQSVTAFPEITKVKITNDIEFIILACDGVWDCVHPQKLCEHISLRLKSKDNISCILTELFDQIISKTNNSKCSF